MPTAYLARLIVLGLLIPLTTLLAGPAVTVQPLPGVAPQPDQPYPVLATLQTDRPFRGLLEVGTTTYLIQQEIAVGPGTFRWWLYPVATETDMQWQLLDEEGERLMAQPLPRMRLVAADVPQVWQIGDATLLAADFRRLPAELLPDQWIGFLATDMVLWQEVGEAALTTAQRRAMADWLDAGGTLVLAPGAVPPVDLSKRGSLATILRPTDHDEMMAILTGKVESEVEAEAEAEVEEPEPNERIVEEEPPFFPPLQLRRLYLSGGRCGCGAGTDVQPPIGPEASPGVGLLSGPRLVSAPG